MDTKIERLMQEFPGSFSSTLGIDLSSQSSEEIFKWFLASILFGARISETIVVNTYRVFQRGGILSPQQILKTGWDGLVARLDEGGYVRYDFKTADKLLEVMKSLLDQYNGDLQNVHDRAQDPRDLEKRLQDLGRGIGNVTTNIFLRELRGLWPKAEPLPSSLVILVARNLKLISKSKSTEILQELKTIWEENKIAGKDFVDFEAALLRLGKDFCRKRKCDTCALEELCEQNDSG